MPRLLDPTEASIVEAAQSLRDGEVVAFPTETVYGLGADTFSVAALERVYELKGRPARNPLIAHVLDEDQAGRVAAVWDERCRLLARRFWPGPLTLVVPRAARVPQRATAGWPTIAVRAPDHPVARRLLSIFGGPISAPSANRSGRVSPTAARHVVEDFKSAGGLLVLDGGPCEVGIESTVVALSGKVPAVLRPGAVSGEALREVLGEVKVATIETQLESPGTSGRHYAPATPAELVSGGSLPARLEAMAEPAVVLCFTDARICDPHRAIIMPQTPEAYAARLYDALRQADASGVMRIVIEEPTDTEGLWAAVRDRLLRATSQP